MIERVTFHPKHLDILQIQDEYRNTVLNLDNAKTLLNNIPGGEQGEALTLMIDGRILACCGYFLVLPGVAQVWVLPSIYVHDHSLIFVRVIDRYLKSLFKTFDWHRMQTVTEVNDKHRRWMKVLGFKEEGIMEQYFNGRDYIMSARLLKKG